jgi:hypothetical protein
VFVITHGAGVIFLSLLICVGDSILLVAALVLSVSRPTAVPTTILMIAVVSRAAKRWQHRRYLICVQLGVGVSCLLQNACDDVV